MNRINRSVVAGIVVGGIGLGTIGVVRAGLLDRGGPAPVRLDDEHHWKHPHMHAALLNLKDARHELEDSEAAFRGHKEEALDHVDKAIKAIHDGLKEKEDDEAVTPALRVGSAQLDDDRFPHVRKALEHLRSARKELDDAAKDFGRNREDAIEQTNRAIKQLEEAIH